MGWHRLPQALLGSLGCICCLCDQSKCGEGEIKGHCLKTTFHTRKYSVLHLPPPLTSLRRTSFLLGSPKMAPHSYWELPVWADAFGPARAAGCGWAEPFGCYWVPELSVQFPEGKGPPRDGLLGVKQEVWQQPPRWAAGHSAGEDSLSLLMKHKSKETSFSTSG